MKKIIIESCRECSKNQDCEHVNVLNSGNWHPLSEGIHPDCPLQDNNNSHLCPECVRECCTIRVYGKITVSGCAYYKHSGGTNDTK